MNRVWPRLNSRPKRSVHVFTFPYLGEHADAQRVFSDFEFRRHNSVDASRRRADDPETLLNLIVCRMGQGLLVTPRRDRGCRASRRCRIDAIEPEVAEFQRIDEHIDRANRIALVDPIIKAFRQQRRLVAIRPLNETLHHPPAIQQGNHSIDGVFTRPGSFSDFPRAERMSSLLSRTDILRSDAKVGNEWGRRD